MSLQPVGANMPARETTSRFGTYLIETRGMGYSVLLALPLALLYEIGIRFATGGEIRIGADVWIRHLLGMVGLGDTLALTLTFTVVAAVIVGFELRRGVRFRMANLGLMFSESLVYAIVSGTLVASLVNGLLRMQWPPQLQQADHAVGMTGQIALSIGAGFYEELFFRLILVSALAGILKIATRRPGDAQDRMTRGTRYALAAVVGAAIFSWVHYTGAYGDTFTIASFTFRFVMGLLLNAIFLWRGFGIAAMTHSLYDIIVTVVY